MMLDVITAKINAVVPIIGLSADGDTIFDILYVKPPTEQQLEQVTALVADWPLAKAKLLKLQQVDAEWAQIVKAGWETPQGWRLGIDISDVTLLMGAFMLAKEAAALGFNAPAHIIDTNGVSHEISVADLTQLMLAYGQARTALSTADAEKRKAINDATSLAELEAL